MAYKNTDDEMISTFVRSLQYKIPDSVEEQVKVAMAKAKTRKAWQWGKPLVWYPVSVAAAMVIIAAIFIFQPFTNKKTVEPVTPITEIKTQFELRDKNIKILWVQKKDFELRLKD